jgi:hypothetical protein
VGKPKSTHNLLRLGEIKKIPLISGLEQVTIGAKKLSIIQVGKQRQFVDGFQAVQQTGLIV